MGETARQLFGAGFPLLAGYLFTRVSYYRRFKAEFMRTDHFAFFLLGYSLAFYLVGAVAAGLVPHWVIPQFAGVVEGLEKIGFTAAVANSLVVAVAWAWWCNYRIWKRVGEPEIDDGGQPRGKFRLAALELFVRESADASLRLLFRATVQKKLIMVTLKSQKVYVGQPIIPDFEPSSRLASIRLIPFVSGYRDESKRVHLPTRYHEIEDMLTDNVVQTEDSERDLNDPLRSDMAGLAVGEQTVMVDIEDFGIVIPWADVESATIFDANIFNAFQQPEPESEGPAAPTSPAPSA